jgi:DNA-binding NarL/FixJ family response regulator
MRAGVSVYCTKDVQPDRLVEIIRVVAQGGHVMGDQEIDLTRIERYVSAPAEEPANLYSDLGEPVQPLSSREMEVLSYVTKGLSNKEIATMLGISHQTVKNHVTAILRKLGVEDRTQAAIYALRRGWVRLYQTDTETEE